jgi:hypothetical protein
VLAEPLLPLQYDGIDAVAVGQAYVAFDPELGWVSTPDIDWVHERIHYRNTHDGLRANRTYTPIPPTGIHRLAAYGDSFTYSEQVDVNECWTSQLEARLPETEVLNFGVPGYGPDQAWLRYQLGGAGWQPCAAVTDALGDQARESGLNRVIAGHLQPLGNAVVARTLADRLPALTAATCGRS